MPAYSRSFFESPLLFEEPDSLLEEPASLLEEPASLLDALDSLFDAPESALDAPDSFFDEPESFFDVPASLPLFFELDSELLRSALRSAALFSAPGVALSGALVFGCEPGAFLRASLLRSAFESFASGVLSLRPGRVLAGSEPVPAGRAERSDASWLALPGLVDEALGVRFASVAFGRFGSVVLGVDASRPGCVVELRAEASGLVDDPSRFGGVVVERSVVVVLVAAAPVELRSVEEPLTVVLVRLMSAAFRPKCV